MSLYIAGAGGFGREVLDALLACGTDATAFLDDHRAGDDVRGLRVLKPSELGPAAPVVVAIADPAVRHGVVERLAAAGAVFKTVVHPRAAIAPDTVLGEGCVVLANAYISSSVRLGRHVHVNYNATVGHDTVVGDYAVVLPGANVAGNVRLGAGCVIGSGAVVLQGRSVGEGAVVGAGAVVVADVPPGAVAKGVPARHNESPPG